jgi:hypothetical protein
MSSTSTPPPASQKLATVTPSDTTGETPVRLVRFKPADLKLIVSLVSHDNDEHESLTSGIDALFSLHWKVYKWEDLMVFSSSDVAAALIPGTNVPPELTAPVIVKKLGYIVDYAHIGILTPTLTMNEIVSSVTASKRRVSSEGSAASPTRRAVQVFDKKAVPTLDKFSGHDEDYFTWKEATVNILGTAGFGRFLDDKSMSGKHPEVAESVFYALRGAVHGGKAQSIVQGMLDDKRLDPTALWIGLEAYYDTALNRANVVLFDIRRLLNIRLDPDTPATKFLSDFRNCLQRLRKNNARISDDTDTLRALLLVAIQDDDFEIVRDSIVHKPDSSVSTILTEIRERETSLIMKDRAANLGGDGTGATRYSRRTSQSSTGTPNRSGGTGDSGVTKKWSIPKYPDTWRQAFGGSLFKLLLDWRVEAHRGKSQTHLNDHFTTVVEQVRTGSAGGGRSKTKSRRASSTASKPSTAIGDLGAQGTDDNADDVQDRSGEPPRKRIRLQKSRRIVTERNA